MSDVPEFLPPEGDEQIEQENEQVNPSALAILNQSEHAAMVSTANLPRNRRRLVEFESKLMAYANHSQPIAISMFYSLPRAGKQIIGPSVRFAEIAAPCWRNCAVGSRAMGEGDKTITAQGIFIDYEANLRNSVEVPRRITDKDGKRFSEDMIVTTMNAAMSVARRNSVLKGGVPQALWTPAYEAAQLTAVGKAASHAQRVADAMEYLHKLGVTEWQILNAVGVASIKELETEHLVTLKVLCQEIKRGDKTIEQVFGSPYDKEIEVHFAQLKMNAAQQTMLRNSYLGRAADLAAYLKERLGSAKPTAPPTRPPEPKPTAPAPAAPAPTPATSFAYGANEEPTDRGVAAGDPDAHLWTDEEVATLKSEGVIVEDPAPAPPPIAQQVTDLKDRGADAPEPPTRYQMPDVPMRPQTQTTMEPQRRRGRPTREEAAARKTPATPPPMFSETPDDFQF